MFGLTCYFDASYDERKTITVVSGWLATNALWENFVLDWRILLAKYDLPYFHMKEFAHSNGPFISWKGDENKRVNFLSRAVDTIGRNVLHGFACLVRESDFNKVNKLYHLSENMGDPYSLCARSCVADANLWLRKKERELSVEYIFERGDVGAKELVRIMQQHQLPVPIFRPSRDTASGEAGAIPLQAADLAAYELLKALRDVGDDAPVWKYRRSLQALGNIPNKWGQHKEEQLLDMCKSIPIEARDLTIGNQG